MQCMADAVLNVGDKRSNAVTSAKMRCNSNEIEKVSQTKNVCFSVAALVHCVCCAALWMHGVFVHFLSDAAACSIRLGAHHFNII